MKEKDEAIEELVEQLEKAVNRYIESEALIVSYISAPWWKRLFFSEIFLTYILKSFTKNK